jgi:hypothetical protein
MQDTRTAEGSVSWKSIGQARMGGPISLVSDCMEPAPQVLSLRTPLIDAVAIIVRQELVLVRGKDRRICGLVTTTDLSEEFQKITGAFLVLGDIERLLRLLIAPVFSIDELRSVVAPHDRTRPLSSVSGLTIGAYVRLLDDPANWDRLRLEVDRQLTIERLTAVRNIRNRVMHFDPEGLREADSLVLSSTREFLRRAAKKRA